MKSSKFKLEQISVPDEQDLPVVVVDELFVHTHVHSDDAEPRITNHHIQLFLSAYSPIVQYAKEVLVVIDQYIEEINSARQKTIGKLSKTTEFLKKNSNDTATPWTWFDITSVAVSLLGSFILLAIGINIIATYLIGSGYIIFIEKPHVAYLLSALNVGVALLFKLGWSWQDNTPFRENYFRCLWVMGLFSSFLWLVSFSALFPNIAPSSIDEIIEGLSSTTKDVTLILESVFVGSQLLAEVLIAATLWIYVERKVSEHAPPFVMHENPEHLAYRQRLDIWEEKLRKAAEKRGELKGIIGTASSRRSNLLEQALRLLIAERLKWRQENIVNDSSKFD